VVREIVGLRNSEVKEVAKKKKSKAKEEPKKNTITHSASQQN